MLAGEVVSDGDVDAADAILALCLAEVGPIFVHRVSR
jgi:hypothetical protein